MKHIYSLVLGILFGIALSKALATDYTTIANMFLFRDFHLYGVIVFAIITVFVGTQLFKKFKTKDIYGKPIEFPLKHAQKGLIFGSIFFGIGWAITGTCPGTAVVQLGEGKLTALITLVGIFGGSLVHGLYAGKKHLPVNDTCG
jgi:uncharacterized membrane protein YedE/YeeE